MQTENERERPKPPPIEGFSAAKFRQWLAGYDSSYAEIDDADADQLRDRLAQFVGRLPMIYGFDDRLKMWERIGSAVAFASQSADTDMGEWTSAVLLQLNAPHSIVASNEQFQRVMVAIVMTPVYERAAMLRLAKSQSYVVLSMAREIWEACKVDAAEAREARKAEVAQ
jgi:hypothetical protein